MHSVARHYTVISEQWEDKDKPWWQLSDIRNTLEDEGMGTGSQKGEIKIGLHSLQGDTIQKKI